MNSFDLPSLDEIEYLLNLTDYGDFSDGLEDILNRIHRPLVHMTQYFGLVIAKNNKIDMIVMGSQRLKGISRLQALGSVTRKMSER